MAEAPPRVLVADDQSDVIVALRLLLGGTGLAVDAASSPAQVRERLAAGPYDLVLMDLNYTRDTTSGREGLDLLAEIHGQDRLLPVIVMTGWGDVELAVEAMRRGARTFVRKPWDNGALTATVVREIEEGRALRHAEARALAEHEDAQAIQRALLPRVLPAVPGVELAARWVPATAFGGDCYDVQPLTDTRVALSIADVCGKGLPAALLMSNLLASVRAFATPARSPREVVAHTNRALCRHNELGRFVTLFFADFCAETRVLRYTNAGHNPPVLVRHDGTCTRLTTGGLVAGLLADTPYDERSVQLDAGDRLVLFTDGITEARAASDEEFGDDRLAGAVRAYRGLNAAGLVAGVFGDLHRFAPAGLADDATMLALAVG